MSFDLWGGVRIPIVLLSGEVNSGKTLWGLLADPNCRKPGVSATTIWWDNEGSAETYAGSLNFDWRDVRSAVADGYHLRTQKAGPNDPKWRRILIETADVNDSPSASLFRAWYLHLLSIEPGRYAVGGVDTFTPIQEGLIEWLRRHPEAFGRTAGQYDKASSMFLWPDVKTMLGYILTTDCRLRFSTFVLTLHLKNEWAGGAKTGQRIAEGLDTLDKLATLHLRLDRTPPAKNKDAPRKPSAIVVKERLVSFGATAEEDRPILPPRLPDASPDAIRAYIAAPPDFANLKPAERMPDQSLTEDQRLQIAAATAADNRAAEETAMTRLEMMRRAAGVSSIAMPAHGHGTCDAGAAPLQTESLAGPSASSTATPAPRAVAPAAPADTGPKMATAGQIKELEDRLMKTFSTPEEGRAWFLSGSGGLRPADLTESAMTDCLAALCRLQSERVQSAAAAKLAAASPAAAAAVVTQPPAMPPVPPDGLATQEQRDTIRRLSEAIGLTQEYHIAWLTARGVNSYRSLSFEAAQSRIEELESGTVTCNSPIPADDEIPF